MNPEPLVSFLWPLMHWLLIGVPLLVFFYIRLQQRRRQKAAQSGAFGLFATQASAGPGWRRHLPPALFLIGLTIIIAALARPYMEISVPRVEGVIMLVFDVSGSMAAEDLEPSRMEAAKAAAKSFVEGQPETIQVGVVAFSDNGFALQPPTSDREAIFSAIDRLAPQRGTALGHGIMASLNTVIGGTNLEQLITENPGEDTSLVEKALEMGRTFPYAAILLLTDGENNENPDPLETAQIAAELDVSIHALGVGTTAGTVIEAEGFSVHTRLEDGLLRQITEMSGGEYYSVAGGDEDLQEIYGSLRPQLIVKPETMEVTAIFTAAGILFLLAGGILSLVWFGRLP